MEMGLRGCKAEVEGRSLPFGGQLGAGVRWRGTCRQAEEAPRRQGQHPELGVLCERSRARAPAWARPEAGMGMVGGKRWRKLQREGAGVPEDGRSWKAQTRV